MTDCLLCEARLANVPSWQQLFHLKKAQFICESCSKQFQPADIKDKSRDVSSIQSIFIYNEAMQNYLHQFKFLQDVALAAVFQEDIRQALRGKKHIIPIPMHADKRRTRTFEQVEALLQAAKLPYEQPLEKIIDTAMSEKTRAERVAMTELFRLKKEAIIEPTTYVLFDDIYTTGTTLQLAAQVLLEAGAKRVEAVTLIRA